MERLTKRIDAHYACYAMCETECPDGIFDDNKACMCRASFAAMKKLIEYEDLEEQGLLLRLPCKVGDTVYELLTFSKQIQPIEIISVYIGRRGEFFYYCDCNLSYNYKVFQDLKCFSINKIGKDIFLTREEAEAALNKMNGNK